MIAAIAAIALSVGQSNQLTSTCQYSDGSSDSCIKSDTHGNAVTSWIYGTPGVVAVDSNGIAKALKAGTTTVTAMVGKVASNPIVLTVSSPTSLVYGYLGTPGNVNGIEQCQTLQFSAYGITSDGVTHNPSATWSTSNSAIGTISPSGLFTATGPGVVSVYGQISPAVKGRWDMYISAGAAATQTLKPGTYTVTVSPCGSASLFGVGVTAASK